MKVNVHGLVFVGFAAAILAGAAHAAGENIVTSKAYTDATYQAKSTALSVGNTGGVWTAADTTITDDATSVPTTAAIKSYVDDAISGVTSASGEAYELKSNKLDGTTGNTIGATTSGQDGNDTTMYPSAAAVKEYVQDKLTGEQNGIITQTIENADTTHAPSGDAVYDALAGKQNKVNGTADASKGWVGNGDGQWLSIEPTTFASVVKYTDTTLNKDVMHVEINALTNANSGNFDNVGGDTTATQVDNDKLPTAAAVKAYVDSKATSDLSGKQDKTGATSGYKVGNSDGTWADMGSAVTAATGGYVSVTGGTNGAAVAINIDANKIDTTVTSDSSNLVTSDAVYDALHGNGTTDLGYERVENKVTSTTGLSSSSSDTQYPSAKTVYDAIQTATGGNTIPQKNPEVCTASYPCALVAEGSNLNWRVMAVGGNQPATGAGSAGYCGNVGGNCPTGA